MSEKNLSFSWRHLEDLPDSWNELVSFELAALAGVWTEQKQRLEQTDAARLQRFKDELHREWAIETGVIEGLYTLDRGITQILIQRGIQATLIPEGSSNRRPELVASIIKDQHDTVEGLFDFVKQQRELSTSYIKELHAALTRHQTTCQGVDSLGRKVEIPLERGKYKRYHNNPTFGDRIHSYCPPEHVDSEMDRLVELHSKHGKVVSTEVSAAWLHHRFTQIHPFMDGNGRVARAMASLVFIQAGWFPLVVTRDDRSDYIASCEAADTGDLNQLVGLFVRIQKRQFLKALTISEKALHEDHLNSVVEALRDDLLRRREERVSQWERAKSLAGRLLEISKEQMTGLAADLKTQLGPLLGHFEASCASEKNDGSNRHYQRYQIVETARQLGYYANTQEYQAWCYLRLQTSDRTELLVSFQGLGYEYRGLLAGTTCFYQRVDGKIIEVIPLVKEHFQVNYLDDQQDVEQRFRIWLEHALARGLDLWRRSLL